MRTILPLSDGLLLSFIVLITHLCLATMARAMSSERGAAIVQSQLEYQSEVIINFTFASGQSRQISKPIKFYIPQAYPGLPMSHFSNNPNSLTGGSSTPYNNPIANAQLQAFLKFHKQPGSIEEALYHVTTRGDTGGQGRSYELYLDDKCKEVQDKPSESEWIALVNYDKSYCKKEKLLDLVFNKNPRAVFLYSKNNEEHLKTIEPYKKGDDGLVINIGYSYLKEVLGYCFSDINSTRRCNASLVINYSPHDSFLNKTSVLFVSISFILLMIISLAWLVFYYVQRFRYIHSKERMSKRLARLAEKAVARIPIKTLKPGDKETDPDFDQCAICIEPYKAQENISVLPCRHYYHKNCIDPWLLEQRSCPMCKLDILRAFGLQAMGERGSMIFMDHVSDLDSGTDIQGVSSLPDVHSTNNFNILHHHTRSSSNASSRRSRHQESTTNVLPDNSESAEKNDTEVEDSTQTNLTITVVLCETKGEDDRSISNENVITSSAVEVHCSSNDPCHNDDDEEAQCTDPLLKGDEDDVKNEIVAELPLLQKEEEENLNEKMANSIDA